MMPEDVLKHACNYLSTNPHEGFISQRKMGFAFTGMAGSGSI